MEDLQAYIESGVLELYVLGDLSAEEKEQVEAMLEKHPELRHELGEIERALEKYAEKHAIEPEAGLRNTILGGLDIREEASVTPMLAQNQHLRRANFYKYAFAASVVLLLVSIASIITLNNRLEESNMRIVALEASNQKFSSRVNYINRRLLTAEQTLDVYQNPAEYNVVELKGLPRSPKSRMMVAFNPAKSTVMIDLDAVEMPDTDAQHQYQLWALVDGKPVDLGVFDTKADSTGMIKMKPVQHAQAFAVTLEPHGGSVSPTLDQLIVMGNISN